MKRSQITILLIVIVSVLVISIIYFITNSTVTEIKAEKSAEKVLSRNLDVSQIQSFGNNCIDSIINFNLQNYHNSNITVSDSENISLYFNINLTADIDNKLTNCLDFSSFEIQGYEINQDTISPNLNINPLDVQTTVDTKIDIVKKDESAKIEEFSSKINSPLGLFMISSQLILDDFTPPIQLNFDKSPNCVFYRVLDRVNISGVDNTFTVIRTNQNITFDVINGNFIGTCP